MTYTRKQIVDAVSPIVRKYDWQANQVTGGYKLTVTDGVETASVKITGEEDIEAEALRLIAEVDDHKYNDLDG